MKKRGRTDRRSLRQRCKGEQRCMDQAIEKLLLKLAHRALCLVSVASARSR